jgi:hypothetical protein
MNLTKIDLNIKVWHNFLHIVLWQGFRTSEVDPRNIVVNTKPFTQVCELHIKLQHTEANLPRTNIKFSNTFQVHTKHNKRVKNK